MGFERCHPAVNFLFFTAVIAGAALFRHPVFLLIGFCCAFAYAAKRGGGRAAARQLILLPLIVVFALYYGTFTHFGVTVLGKNFAGNALTLESLVYGCVLGTTAAAVILWFSCVHSVITADKVVYLLGRVSPRLSLFLAILLRMVPGIRREAGRISTAQKGIGRGVNQGSPTRRLRNAIRIFSMLITWTVDALTAASDAMACRGGTLRGRTAFSVYRFDNRDRAFVIGMFTCLTFTAMAVMLRQTEAIYDPGIRIPPITAMSWLFFFGYTALCLMPLALELWTEYRFRKARNAL